MLLALNHIVYYVQDRCMLAIENLKVTSRDRIGIIGRNGAGKSTLLKVMAGIIQPDQGEAVRYCSYSYIAQADGIPLAAEADEKEMLSGGEIARRRQAVAFGKNRLLLLADEPTANLDIQGVEWLQAKLQGYQGACIIVSHDRRLLDEVCNTIWEIREGKLQVYQGNYSDYLRQKENETKHQEKEYEKYIQEKQHLVRAVLDRQSRSAVTRKTPKRMGNSEARLHKMGDQKAKANLDKAVKAIESRLDKLVVKKRPKELPAVRFQIDSASGLSSKVVIRAEQISQKIDKRTLFHEVSFSIMRRQKVALVGANGCGKTTLLEKIRQGDEAIYVASNARIGYFSQVRNDLRPNESILASVMKDSIHSEAFVRDLLAQFLFRRDDVYKQVGVLSGGERVRVALAKIMVSNANVLLLDEPTTYLDLPSIEALESVLADYDGTILFASHDRKFIDKIANQLLVFQNETIQLFQGAYAQYVQACETASRRKNQNQQEERFLLEYRLAAVSSKLSVTKDQEEVVRLDEEYQSLLKQLNHR